VKFLLLTYLSQVPSLLRASLGPGLYFLILDVFQDDRTGNENHKLRVFFEGGFARATAGFLLCPLTVVKTRSEWARGPSSLGTFEALVKIAKEEKLAGLFRGTIPTLIRDVPASGMYLVLYQGMFQPWAHEKFGANLNSAFINLNCAIGAGVIASVVTHPADVIKTQMQLNNVSIRVGMSSLWNARGAAGYMSGVTARLFRRPLSMAITWTIYEIIKGYQL